MGRAAAKLRRDGVFTALASAPPLQLAQSDSWQARDLLHAADGAVVASGTATLEAAVLGTPLAVVYRMGGLSWFAAQRLVKVPWVSLPNLVAGKEIVPELLQQRVTDDGIYRRARALLEPQERMRQQRELAKVRRRLGSPGAAERVAALILERLP